MTRVHARFSAEPTYLVKDAVGMTLQGVSAFPNGYGFAKVTYTETTNTGEMLHFCTREAAEKVASLMNIHFGGEGWKVVEDCAGDGGKLVQS